MIRNFIISILLTFIPLCFHAQSGFQAESSQVCGTDEHHAFLMRTKPEYKARHLERMAVLKQRIRQETSNPRQLPPQYTIPVVVHIVHLGETIGMGTNIPDEQVLDALNGLNDRYANVNAMGTDIEINFCLANRDPNGCPTSGINRVNGSNVPNYAGEGIQWGGGCGADEFEIKSLIAWPVDQYYNIWVVHDICGDVAGYAYYPNGDWYDGAVIDIASTNYGSRTLAHELGHGLNLQHTFSGDEDGTMCPTNFDCLEQGDEICDTPPHKRNDCGINIPCGASGEWDDSRFNWMSYCSTDVGMGRFTEDQRTRMRTTMLEWPRNSLTTSLACSNAENMRITSENNLMCSGETRELFATPAGGFFAVASGPGQINGNILTATAGGTVLVEYVVSQEECTSSVFQAIQVKQAANSKLIPAADELCVGQSIKLTGIPGGGEFSVVSGPGSLVEDTLTADDLGAIELSYHVFVLGCPSTDEAVVIAQEASEVDIEFLTDDVLAAVPVTGTYQWLRCDDDYEAISGATESILVASASGNYAVVMYTVGGCIDTSDCVQVELTSLEDDLSTSLIRLYPNPATDIIYLEGEASAGNLNLSIADLQGKTVLRRQISNQAKSGIDISALPAGVYVLSVQEEGKGKRYFRFVKA